jgi:hypothetical protein
MNVAFAMTGAALPGGIAHSTWNILRRWWNCPGSVRFPSVLSYLENDADRSDGLPKVGFRALLATKLLPPALLVLRIERSTMILTM